MNWKEEEEGRYRPKVLWWKRRVASEAHVKVALKVALSREI
jgi:hypothetical protein